VTIEGNSFEGYGPRGAIAVSNAEHVTIRGNRFGEPDTRVARGPAVALELCRDIVLEGNSGIGGAAPVVTFSQATDRGSVIQR